MRIHKPNKIKPQEVSRVNLAWINISRQHFIPITGVRYLWVYTRYGIIVGIEEPWKYPQAFINVYDQDQLKIFHSILKPRLKQSGKLGHPTLATAFDHSGISNVIEGGAYLGGELYYTKGAWIIDDHSGRFPLKTTSENDAHIFMLEVQNNFKQLVNFHLPLKINITHKDCSHLSAYLKIWNDTQGNDYEKAICILQEYVKSNWFHLCISAHWNRHHVRLVKSIIVESQQLEVKNPQSLLQLFEEKISSKNIPINLSGSLARRLSFIAKQTNTKFIANKPTTHEQTIQPKNLTIPEHSGIEQYFPREQLTANKCLQTQIIQLLNIMLYSGLKHDKEKRAAFDNMLAKVTQMFDITDTDITDKKTAVLRTLLQYVIASALKRTCCGIQQTTGSGYAVLRFLSSPSGQALRTFLLGNAARNLTYRDLRSFAVRGAIREDLGDTVTTRHDEKVFRKCNKQAAFFRIAAALKGVDTISEPSIRTLLP